MSSYTHPAKCPVCHAAVFFYHSTDDGRVFFDELGPPWPKHYCTDTSTTPAKLSPPTIDLKEMPNWKREGWRRFYIRNAIELDRWVYRLRGTLDRSPLTIFVRKDASPLFTSRDDFKKGTIAFLRNTGSESVELSLMLHFGVSVSSIEVFSSPSKAHRRKAG